MSGYPQVSLLGYVDDEVVPDAAAGLEQLVAQLLQARAWAGTPPEVAPPGNIGDPLCPSRPGRGYQGITAVNSHAMAFLQNIAAGR